MQCKVENKWDYFLLKVDKYLIFKEINFKQGGLIGGFLSYENIFAIWLENF